jgi:hypothetical protein
VLCALCLKEFELMLFLICLIAGIALGIAYNNAVIKKYPKHDQRTGYVVTIIIFIILSMFTCMIINLKISSKRFIDTNFNKIEQYIIEANSDDEFIQNGIDINDFNNQYIDEIYQRIPSAEELGVNELLRNLAIDFARKSINSKIDNADTAVRVIQNLADENGVITISSFVNRLKYYANTGINKIIFILSIIDALIFLIYLVFCLLSIKYGRET